VIKLKTGILTKNPLILIGGILIIIGLVITVAPISSNPGKGSADVKIYSIEDFMTAVYKIYGDPNLGYWVAKTVIKNTGNGPLYDVKITYKIEGLTDWSEPHEYKLVPAGGAIVDLYYPILASPPNIQTATPGKIYIKIEYKTTPKGSPETITKTRSIKILGSHDFVFSGIPPEENTGSFQDTLSNAPLLAAWVTPKDPVVERFADMANKLTGMGAGAALSDDQAIQFLQAVWIYSVENGITYQTESSDYWTGKVAQFVKYPRDVIRDKSGTCLDTTIFLDAIAMSQGLNAYILLKPGHAIPIIELPSGQLLPIESTMLGGKESFETAVETAVQEVQEALQGPHIIINVGEMHAQGIIPPELPELPPNVLEQWGYTMPGQGGGGLGGGQGGTGGGASGGTGGSQGGGQQPPQPPPQSLSQYSNPFGDIPWSITIPNDWYPNATAYSDMNEVDIFSPDGGIMIAILWTQYYSPSDMEQMFEDYFNQYYGGYDIAGQNSNGRAGNLPAVTVAYSLGTGDFAIARYGSYNGYTIVIIEFIDSSLVSQDTINSVEQIVQTFHVG